MKTGRAILNSRPEAPPWTAPGFLAIPGTRPVAAGERFWVLENYDRQMAEKVRLLRENRNAVLALTASGERAAREFLFGLLKALERMPGFAVGNDSVVCPDGRNVTVKGCPLEASARLIQEDICLLTPDTNGYRMTAAAVCFPSHWTLAEKMHHGIERIHGPVHGFGADETRRVERLFQGLQAGHPIARWNGTWKSLPDLFQPRRETTGQTPARRRFYRVERQVLDRLPRSRAVAFTIHTMVFDRRVLTPDDLAEIETDH